MKTLLPILLTLSSLAYGCSSSPPPSARAPSSDTSMASASKPDVSKTKAHLADHVKYPAKRADILAACADTPEFTSAEKQWLSDNLPEGDYQSADDVARALRL